MSGQRWATYLFLTNRSRPYAASVSITITNYNYVKRNKKRKGVRIPHYFSAFLDFLVFLLWNYIIFKILLRLF